MTRTLDRVRWGIIGVGAVTERKSGPAFQRIAGSELVAVMRRDGAKAADWARRHGVERWYDDADALVADPEVDAVYVATPPDSHLEHALRAAAAGKPAYVEKPIARTAAEGEAMVSAFAAVGVPLFVAYYRRAQQRTATIADLLASGAIGEVRAVSIRLLRPADPAESGPDRPWRVRPEIAGGGHFVDLASHTLDLLDHLLGPVAHARGDAVTLGGRYEAEDTVAAQLTFASGVLGSGLWCFDAASSADDVEILGTRGSLRFATFADEPLTLAGPDGVRQIPAPYPEVVQEPLIRTVVEELTGRGTCPSTGESALRTARVIDAVLAGHRSGLPGR